MSVPTPPFRNASDCPTAVVCRVKSEECRGCTTTGGHEHSAASLITQHDATQGWSRAIFKKLPVPEGGSTKKKRFLCHKFPSLQELQTMTERAPTSTVHLKHTRVGRIRRPAATPAESLQPRRILVRPTPHTHVHSCGITWVVKSRREGPAGFFDSKDLAPWQQISRVPVEELRLDLAEVLPEP